MGCLAGNGRILRALLLCALLAASTSGWAQTSVRRSPRLRFDIRRHEVLARQISGAGAPAVSQLVEQRRAAALAAAAQPGGSTTTILRLNDFGLPKALVHHGGVPAGGSAEPLALARNYLRSQSALFPFSESDLAHLRTVATSRSSGLTFLTLDQTVNGVPVFGGHIRVAFDSTGAVIHAGVDDVIPRLVVDTRAQLQPAGAARKALEWLRVRNLPATLSEMPSQRAGRTVFAHPRGDTFPPIVTELSIFPMSAVSARLAYRVFADSERGRFELLFDAADGRLLYASDLRHEAGRAVVWRESPVKGARESVSLPDSWLAPGGTTTSGNNTDVFLDRDADDEPDADALENIRAGRAFSPSGTFDFPAGEGSTGQDPWDFPAAIITNVFYYVNAAHDYFYGLGFTEQAGNFQNDNLGRGGLGNDAMGAHVHDPLAPGGAAFLAAPEGMAPQLALGIYDQGTPSELNDDRDFALDGEVVFHEYAHGVTSRIVGGPDDVECLLGMQSGAVSEGWSDYFALSHFNNAVLGDYVVANAGHGLRRFAYDRNTLTYEDLGNEGFQVHNDGEIWAATLWEIRGALGQQITDRLVTDALRLTPCNPHMIDARDGILDADQAAFGASHHTALWQIFARRGMGHAASGFDGEVLDSNVFNAAYNLPPSGAGANSFPAVIGRPQDLALVGEPYLYTVLATDADSDPLRFELVEGPPGMTVDATSGRVTYPSPTFISARAKVAVTDGKGGRVVHGFSIPTLAELTAGRSITIDGPADSQGFAGIIVPRNTPLLQVTLRGSVGDADILLLGPNNLGISARPGVNETVTIVDPAPGAWVMLVEGVEAYSGVSLTASFPRATALVPGSRVNNLQGPLSSETFHQFAVPEGATSLTVSTGGGSGDVDLFLARGRYPVCQISDLVFEDCDFDDASLELGNFEIVTVNASAAARAIRSAGGRGPALMRLTAGEPLTVPLVEAGQWFLNLSATDTYQGVTLTLTVDSAGSAAPVVSAGGVVNAASFAAQLAPGGIATLFGSNLADAAAQPGSVPLPRELGGARVLVGGVEAPLFYVSPAQINFQTPFETPAGSVAVLVERGGVPSAVMEGVVQRNAPGIFTYAPGVGTTAAVIIHADGSLVTAASPARAGEVLLIFATGVGALTDPPPTGEASRASPLAVSADAPTVTVGGAEAKVLFAGLTPDFVGLLQVNLQMPDTLPAGNELDLVLAFGSDAAQTVKIAVE